MEIIALLSIGVNVLLQIYIYHVITVGIGWVLLASATSGFNGYISSLPTAPLPRDFTNSVVRAMLEHLTGFQKVLGSIPIWALYSVLIQKA